MSKGSFAARSLVAVLVLVLAAPALAGVIVPTAQARSVSGSANADDSSGTATDSDSASAPDFAPFVEGRSAIATLPEAIGTGGGTQDSSIVNNSILAQGSAFATAESFAFDSSADGFGDSRFDMDFTLTSQADYTLQGFIEAFDSGSADLTLEDTGGMIFSTSASGGQTVIDESGTLPAGDYRLEVVALGSTFADFFTSDFASAEYRVTFRVSPTTATVPAMGGWAVLFTAFVLGGSGARARRR